MQLVPCWQMMMQFKTADLDDAVAISWVYAGGFGI
jgi:hypothetical protein